MPVWIGVHLPHLNLEAFRPRLPASSPDDAHGLVVLESGRAVAVDRAARALGVVAGMRRGGVLSLAPDAQIRERELELGVAYALLQFTPNVVHADAAVVLLDVTGNRDDRGNLGEFISLGRMRGKKGVLVQIGCLDENV
jgi:protein ImuB